MRYDPTTRCLVQTKNSRSLLIESEALPTELPGSPVELTTLKVERNPSLAINVETGAYS